jgi:hypothetical protein
MCATSRGVEHSCLQAVRFGPSDFTSFFRSASSYIETDSDESRMNWRRIQTRAKSFLWCCQKAC